jgi:hypothetical protein
MKIQAAIYYVYEDFLLPEQFANYYAHGDH